MILPWLSPRLLAVVLALVWGLVLATVLATWIAHARRVRAARRAEALDRRARPLVARFVLAEDEDPALREELREAAGAYGDRVDERLLAVLESITGQGRDRVVALLVDRGHPQRLRRRARSRRPLVRAAALRRLGLLALPTDADLMRRATADRSGVVASVAARALAAHPSAASAGAVLDLLGEGRVPHLVVVDALIAQGSREGSALARIREGLADPSPRVRAVCAQTLGELTSTADAPRLAELLRGDPTAGVQLAAAAALRRVGRAGSVPALLEGTRSAWGPVRLQSLQALLALPADVAADALAEVSRRGDPLLAPLLPRPSETPGS